MEIYFQLFGIFLISEERTEMISQGGLHPD